MRAQFFAWYPLSPEERRRFVTDGLIVLDTNVLLHLYRMSANARSDVLSLLRQLGDRLWIPHQVGLEFHRNRLAVIYEQEQAHQTLRAVVIEVERKLHDAIRNMRDHPVIDRKALTTTVDKALASITHYLDQAREEPSLSMESATRADPILDAVTDLLIDKVGSPFGVEELGRVQADAQRRISEQRPPGYADTKKDPDRAAGDYVLWRQMLDEAAKRKLSVLFITNDQKEDWYRRLHGQTVGPRVELIIEMNEEAGVAFHAQTLVRFLETSPSLLHSVVKETTVSELNRLDEVNRATLRAEMASEHEHRWPGSRSPERSVPLEQLTAEIFRLEQQWKALSASTSDLQAKLSLSRSVTDDSDLDRQQADPRSYIRAVEARLASDSLMMAGLEQHLSALRSEQARRLQDGADG